MPRCQGDWICLSYEERYHVSYHLLNFIDTLILIDSDTSCIQVLFIVALDDILPGWAPACSNHESSKRQCLKIFWVTESGYMQNDQFFRCCRGEGPRGWDSSKWLATFHHRDLRLPKFHKCHGRCKRMLLRQHHSKRWVWATTLQTDDLLQMSLGVQNVCPPSCLVRGGDMNTRPF